MANKFARLDRERQGEVPGRTYDHGALPEDVDEKWAAVAELMEDHGLEAGQYADLPQDVASAEENRMLYVPILGKYLTPAEFTAFKTMWTEGGRGAYDPEGQNILGSFVGRPEVFESRALIEPEADSASLYEAAADRKEQGKDRGFHARIQKLLAQTLGAGAGAEAGQ